MPATGTEPPNSDVSPYTCALGRGSGSEPRVHAEQLAQLGVPAPLADVEQQRARRVRGVGRVLARELEDEPGVDRAERRRRRGTPPSRDAATRSSCRRSTGRARARCARARAARGPPRAARRSGAAVRRSCQTIARCSGSPRVAVPGDHRLALVRDADRRRARRPSTPAASSASLRHGARDVPDLARVVLHPAGPREVLAELAVGAPGRAAALVEHDARRAGGALVDREDQDGRQPIPHAVIAACPGGRHA